MYGTADQSGKREERQQAERYREIRRLSTTCSSHPYICTVIPPNKCNALNFAGGLCATSAKRPSRPCKFRGRSQSQNRKACLTQTWQSPSQSEWEGLPRPHAWPATCHGTSGRDHNPGEEGEWKDQKPDPGAGLPASWCNSATLSALATLAKASPPDWIHRPNCRMEMCRGGLGSSNTGMCGPATLFL